jgi:hypothetical protein
MTPTIVITIFKMSPMMQIMSAIVSPCANHMKNEVTHPLMFNGSKVMKIAIVRHEIQDGRHKNPWDILFSMGTSKIVFLIHLEVGVIKSFGGVLEVHLATRLKRKLGSIGLW